MGPSPETGFSSNPLPWLLSISADSLILSQNMETNPNWLSNEDWKWVQETMPIPCADVVPVKFASDGKTIQQIGLIYRDTPHQGVRWCMVGGRMWRNESLAEAATRQLRETLGLAIRFDIDPERQPDFVVQYFTSRRSVGYLDPRQHAITLAIVVPVTGEISAMGEAQSFKWFNPDQLPPPAEWGFEQDRATRECLTRWKR
jgi:ADP-ribose pyrophosphatase YjhB (NUDIX family)